MQKFPQWPHAFVLALPCTSFHLASDPRKLFQRSAVILPRSHFRSSGLIRLSLMWQWPWYEIKPEPTVIMKWTFLCSRRTSCFWLTLPDACCVCCSTPTEKYTKYDCPHWEFWADVPTSVFHRLECNKKKNKEKLNWKTLEHEPQSTVPKQQNSKRMPRTCVN